MEYQEYLQAVQDQMTANNQWSALQAQKQMDFQKEMSDTAHQREVEDLKAAGLNPVLSAHSNGASTPAGAMATNNGDINAYAGFLSTILDTENANARANLMAATRAAYNSSANNVTGFDLNGFLNLFGIRQPNSAAAAQASLLNLIKNMDTQKVANNLDEAGKAVAEWLEKQKGISSSPPAGSSAAKAKEYKEKNGNSSTGAGLNLLQKAANAVASLISSSKKKGLSSR